MTSRAESALRPHLVVPIVWILSVMTLGVLDTDGRGEDPFAFFRPWVSVGADDLRALDRREVLVRTLPSDDGHLAVFAAARIRTSPQTFIAWAREIEQLKRGEYVSMIGRFSDPPAPGDIERLTLDPSDLDALRRCEAGSCGLKLASSEISALRYAIGRGGDGWREAAQSEFRRQLLTRIRLYLAGGLSALPPYADHSEPVEIRLAFGAILLRSPYLSRGVPDLVDAFEQGEVAANTPDSYIYWSKEHYGAGKSIVSISHVRVVEPATAERMPAALMASQQLFATHYSTGGLGLTTLFCAPAGDACYLTYLNRSQVDVLGGILGGIKRFAMEQRIRSETPRILGEMRTRVESGDPSAPD
jgi:hypothetical protein